MGKLVLSRKPGQSILIGDDIKITLAEGRGNTKLLIDAPDDVLILREELTDESRGKPKDKRGR